MSINVTETSSTGGTTNPENVGQGEGGAKSDPKALPADTVIKDVNELEKIAPEVAQKLKEGIASTIIKEMREHQARLKKMMREASSGR